MHLTLVVVLGIVACRPSSPHAPDDGSKPIDAQIARVERGLLPAVQVRGEDVRYSIEERMREHAIPALGIAVFHDYELAWVKTYGLADVESRTRASEETTFLAGSISKSVNALAQLQAVADGTLALDAPINDFLTSWKLPDNELTRAKAVTLRMLLSHTGGTTVHGFRGYRPGEPVPTTVQTLDGEPPTNNEPIRVDLAPGTKFRYSGGGTMISQLALSDRTKQPYAALMAARVLKPLGMVHSDYDQQSPARTKLAAVGHDGEGKPVEGARIFAPEMAAAGLWTTAGDLARFFLEITRARAGRSKLIATEIAVQMTTKVADVEGSNDAIGLGVFLLDRNGTPWFGHGGSHIGFQCDALASLDGGNGVVVMASSEGGHKIFGEIQRAVFAEYGWHGADVPVVRVALAQPAIGKFVGRYLVEDWPFEIVQRGDRLVDREPYDDAGDMVPVAEDRVVDREGTELRLRADGGLDMLPRRGGKKVATRIDTHHLWLLEAGQFDGAVAALKTVAKPRDEEKRLARVGLRLIAKSPRMAIEILRLNTEAFPDSAPAHANLGNAYAKAQQMAKAIAEYERAAAALDTDPRVDTGKPAFRKQVDDALAKLKK